LTVDRTLLKHAEDLKRFDLGEAVNVELPISTLKRLQERGFIDSELRITPNGYKSIQEHLKINDFLRQKTLENYALNYMYLFEELLDGRTEAYDKLNYVVRRNLRTRGLIKKKKIINGWSIQPTNLWKKIVNTRTSK
jgi:hypothetical protein